jgi:hypothetical protein
MTAQISYVVVYRGKPHCIAGINGKGLFDPAEHGLKPVVISTACWRGYHCTYEIADGSLLLTQLNIGLDEKDRAAAERDEGPLLCGKVPKPNLVEVQGWDDRTGETTTYHLLLGFVFDGLREIVPFAGGLLLADDFIEELYVHMGFHPAWKFKEVHEVLFEKGRVVKEADRSAEMAEFREMVSSRQLEPTDPDNREEIKSWVERCFSLKYKW